MEKRAILNGSNAEGCGELPAQGESHLRSCQDVGQVGGIAEMMMVHLWLIYGLWLIIGITIYLVGGDWNHGMDYCMTFHILGIIPTD